MKWVGKIETGDKSDWRFLKYWMLKIQSRLHGTWDDMRWEQQKFQVARVAIFKPECPSLQLYRQQLSSILISWLYRLHDSIDLTTKPLQTSRQIKLNSQTKRRQASWSLKTPFPLKNLSPMQGCLPFFSPKRQKKSFVPLFLLFMFTMSRHKSWKEAKNQ
jgi:hypothetical protein